MSLAERLVPPLRRLPVRWRMALRAIGRNPRRATSTVIGIVLALVLILSFWVMIDSATLLIDHQYDDIERQDAQLVFRGPVDPAELDRIRRVPGVEPGRARRRAAGLAAGERAPLPDRADRAAAPTRGCTAST